MGVRTEADERLDSAAEHIHKAVCDLDEILIRECWGHDEYNEDYRDKIDEAFTLLRKARRLLNR